MKDGADLAPDVFLTSREAGEILQVDASTVGNWVKAERIEAFRTPGGHLRIRVQDLVAFAEKHQMPLPRQLQELSRRRLLLVDDDLRQLRSLKRRLKQYQTVLETEFIDNGIDALVRVGAFKPHAVVLDFMMPDLDGIEVCRRLKEAPNTKNVDVVIASGQMDKKIRKKATEAGAILCLEKPFDIRPVLDILGLDTHQRI